MIPWSLALKGVYYVVPPQTVPKQCPNPEVRCELCWGISARWIRDLSNEVIVNHVIREITWLDTLKYNFILVVSLKVNVILPSLPHTLYKLTMRRHSRRLPHNGRNVFAVSEYVLLFVSAFHTPLCVYCLHGARLKALISPTFRLQTQTQATQPSMHV